MSNRLRGETWRLIRDAMSGAVRVSQEGHTFEAGCAKLDAMARECVRHLLALHDTTRPVEDAKALKERLRTVCQMLVEAVGAPGPCDAEDAAQRAVAVIRFLKATSPDGTWDDLTDIRKMIEEAAGYPCVKGVEQYCGNCAACKAHDAWENLDAVITSHRTPSPSTAEPGPLDGVWPEELRQAMQLIEQVVERAFTDTPRTLAEQGHVTDAFTTLKSYMRKARTALGDVK